jgi:hypothetical protein
LAPASAFAIRTRLEMVFGIGIGTPLASVMEVAFSTRSGTRLASVMGVAFPSRPGMLIGLLTASEVGCALVFLESAVIGASYSPGAVRSDSWLGYDS